MHRRKLGIILGWLAIGLAVIAIASVQIVGVWERGRRGPPPSGRAWKPGYPPQMITGVHPLPLGEPAPDFSLPRVADGSLLRLADLRAHKPVVLILSSFTCNVFCGQMAALEKLHYQYCDRAEFLLVVVREAKHPIPGLEFLLLDQNPSMDVRRGLVARALAIKKLTIPAVLDTKNAQVENAYSGWPLRLVVVGTTGLFELDAPFQPPGGLDLQRVSQWLEKHLGPPMPLN